MRQKKMVIEICKFEFFTMTMQTTWQDNEQEDSPRELNTPLGNSKPMDWPKLGGDRSRNSSSDAWESAEWGRQSHQYGARDCAGGTAGTTPTKHDEWKSDANASSDAWESSEWGRPFNQYGASDRAGGTTGTTPFKLDE